MGIEEERKEALQKLMKMRLSLSSDSEQAAVQPPPAAGSENPAAAAVDQPPLSSSLPNPSSTWKVKMIF